MVSWKMSEQAVRVPWRSTNDSPRLRVDLETGCTYGVCSSWWRLSLLVWCASIHFFRASSPFVSVPTSSQRWVGGWEAGECWGASLDYVTSSGRPLELFPPLLGEREKKEVFSLLRLSLSIWTNGKHAQGLLDISPHLHSVSPHHHHHHHHHTASPPLPLQQRIAVLTVWLDHQSWPLTAVFLSTWTGRSQLALS